MRGTPPVWNSECSASCQALILTCSLYIRALHRPRKHTSLSTVPAIIHGRLLQLRGGYDLIPCFVTQRQQWAVCQHTVMLAIYQRSGCIAGHGGLRQLCLFNVLLWKDPRPRTNCHPHLYPTAFDGLEVICLSHSPPKRTGAPATHRRAGTHIPHTSPSCGLTLTRAVI